MGFIDIVNKFDINEKVIEYAPLGNGHINQTYLVTCENNVKYVLQKTNHYVFKMLMD